MLLDKAPINDWQQIESATGGYTLILNATSGLAHSIRRHGIPAKVAKVNRLLPCDTPRPIIFPKVISNAIIAG